MVFVSDPRSVETIFRSDPDVLHAGEANVILGPLLGPTSVLLLDGAAHLRQRKLLLPPFHGERMRRYEALIDQIADRALDRFPQNRAFALHPHMQRITLDVILRAVFGVAEGARLERIRPLLTGALDVPRLALLPALQRDLGPGSPWRRFNRRKSAADELIFEEIERRSAATDLGDREDILSLLLLARDEDGRSMNELELRDELMTLLAAGHETTATALSWCFERLVRSPSILERLEQAVAEGDDAYLEAVVFETLRLRPVIPFVARVLKEPFEIGGWRLPAGATVAPCIYLLHRRADLYPDPETFRPERFLDEPPGTYTWIPFGGGTRRCLGASFALFEMKVILRTIVKRAVLRAAEPKAEPIQNRHITFAPRNRGVVVLERRSADSRATDDPKRRLLAFRHGS